MGQAGPHLGTAPERWATNDADCSEARRRSATMQAPARRSRPQPVRHGRLASSKSRELLSSETQSTSAASNVPAVGKTYAFARHVSSVNTTCSSHRSSRDSRAPHKSARESPTLTAERSSWSRAELAGPLLLCLVAVPVAVLLIPPLFFFLFFATLAALPIVLLWALVEVITAVNGRSSAPVSPPRKLSGSATAPQRGRKRASSQSHIMTRNPSLATAAASISLMGSSADSPRHRPPRRRRQGGKRPPSTVSGLPVTVVASRNEVVPLQPLASQTRRPPVLGAWARGCASKESTTAPVPIPAGAPYASQQLSARSSPLSVPSTAWTDTSSHPPVPFVKSSCDVRACHQRRGRQMQQSRAAARRRSRRIWPTDMDKRPSPSRVVLPSVPRGNEARVESRVPPRKTGGSNCPTPGPSVRASCGAEWNLWRPTSSLPHERPRSSVQSSNASGPLVAIEQDACTETAAQRLVDNRAAVPFNKYGSGSGSRRSSVVGTSAASGPSVGSRRRRVDSQRSNLTSWEQSVEPAGMGFSEAHSARSDAAASLDHGVSEAHSLPAAKILEDVSNAQACSSQGLRPRIGVKSAPWKAESCSASLFSQATEATSRCINAAAAIALPGAARRPRLNSLAVFVGLVGAPVIAFCSLPIFVGLVILLFLAFPLLALVPLVLLFFLPIVVALAAFCCFVLFLVELPAMIRGLRTFFRKLLWLEGSPSRRRRRATRLAQG